MGAQLRPKLPSHAVTPLREIAWLAGLLEGEGCFTFTGRCAQVVVGMTDRDVVDRVAAIFGKHVYTRRPQGFGKLPVFGTAVHGSKAIGIMLTVYPLMCQRRRARIREVVAGWRSRPGYGWRRGLKAWNERLAAP